MRCIQNNIYYQNITITTLCLINILIKHIIVYYDKKNIYIKYNP